MLDRREPDPFIDTFTGLVAARAVTTAVVLGVFVSLHERPASAQELASTAEQLERLVQQFKLAV